MTYRDYEQWRETRLLNPDVSLEAYEKELAAFAALERLEKE